MTNRTGALPTHKQLRHLAVERLRTAILEGQYRPGEWMRQERLAQELGVSQMPVREALKELAVEGLVEHVPYRGVRVIEFSSDDVADLYTHRSYLEGMAARSAARNITNDDILKLKELHQQMQANMDAAHLPEYRELNRRFHQLIYAASKREYLIRTLNQLWATFPSMLWGNFFRTAIRSAPERDSTDVIEHQAIIAALEARDEDRSEKLIRQHIEASGKDLLNALQIH